MTTTLPGLPKPPVYRTSLERVLKEMGMTHREAAVRSGVARENICQYASGVKRAKNLSVVVAIAWGLGVHPTALQDITEKRVPLGPRGQEVDPDRECAHPGCKTLLSKYSTSLKCWWHNLPR